MVCASMLATTALVLLMAVSTSVEGNQGRRGHAVTHHGGGGGGVLAAASRAGFDGLVAAGPRSSGRSQGLPLSRLSKALLSRPRFKQVEGERQTIKKGRKGGAPPPPPRPSPEKKKKGCGDDCTKNSVWQKERDDTRETHEKDADREKKDFREQLKTLLG